jgi:D-lactate dehydrogenase
MLAEEPLIREEAERIGSTFCEQRGLTELVADHVLLRLPNNVVVPPHSAFNTREAVERIVHTTVENIEGFLSGYPGNIVAGPTYG